MFDKLSGISGAMKEMQSKMVGLQTEIEALSTQGTAGGGMLNITINGKGNIKNVTIDPSLINADEVGILEDLIMAAHNDAKQKSEALVKEKTQKIMGGLNLPEGMTL